MKVKLLASVAAAGLFAAGAASAEPDGWYGAIDAGYQWIEPINVESQTNGAARTEFRMQMAECGDCGAVSTQEGGTRPSADQLCGGYTFSLILIATRQPVLMTADSSR